MFLIKPYTVLYRNGRRSQPLIFAGDLFQFFASETQENLLKTFGRRHHQVFQTLAGGEGVGQVGLGIEAAVVGGDDGQRPLAVELADFAGQRDAGHPAADDQGVHGLSRREKTGPAAAGPRAQAPPNSS